MIEAVRKVRGMKERERKRWKKLSTLAEGILPTLFSPCPSTLFPPLSLSQLTNR